MAAARMCGMRLAELVAADSFDLCKEQPLIMWGQPPSAVRRSEAPRLLGRCSRVRSQRERVHKRLLPQPWIVGPSPRQTPPDRVLQQVLDLRIQTLRRPQHMIKRLGLPNPALAAENLIDLVGRRAFHRVHDLGQGIDFHRLGVYQRREDHMHMIRHHDRDAQIESLSVVMETAFQYAGTHRLWKDPSVIGAEGHEVLAVIALEVRKLSAVESLGHDTAYEVRMWGQPPPAVRRSEAPLPFMLKRVAGLVHIFRCSW